MALETKLTLNEDTLAVVQDLISVNLDSEKGFREAAEHCVDNVAVQQLFTELAEQRRAQAFNLQNLAAINGEDPETSGTVAAAAHRFLIDLRAGLGGGAAVMLTEAERGEDYIKQKYEEALKQHAGSAITDLLNKQYVAVKAAHDRVRDLRDLLNK